MPITVNKKIGTTSVSFTPTFYKRAIKNYNQGYYKEFIALCDQAETDSHVAGCLMGRRAGFKKEWSVNPYSEGSQDKAVADFIRENFKALDMRLLFEEIQEARLKAYKVISLDIKPEDGKQRLISFEGLGQKYFRRDPKDEILKLDFGNRLKPIPKDSALVCEIKGIPIGITILRDYILKEFGLEAWASFLETFGEAFILGKYPPGASVEFKTAVETAVNNIGIASRGTAPIGTEFEIHETKRNTGDHKLFKDAADDGISITILGHKNSVNDSSGMQVGENLSAYRVKHEIAVDDIYFIEAQINVLIKILVNRNFNTRFYPKFTIDKTGAIDVKERLEVIRTAYSMGKKIDPAEFAKLGIKVYEDEVDPLLKDFTNPMEPMF